MAAFNSIKKILSELLICAVMVPVCSARTARTRGKSKYPTAFDLLDKYAETQGGKYALWIDPFEKIYRVRISH